jgi:hypothetical protein
MRRWQYLLAMWWMLWAFVGTAQAKPTRKVMIETDPSGATVYVNDKESASVGTTPLVLDLPLGDTTVIFERKGCKPTIKNISVVKGKGPLKQSFVLKIGQGSLSVKLASGADSVGGIDVYLNGQKQGSAPLDVEVDAGSYQVVAKLGTRVVYEESVEVEVDGAATVTIRSKAAPTKVESDAATPLDAPPDAAPPIVTADPDNSSASSDLGTKGSPVVSRPTTYVELAAASSFLIRKVSYQQATTPNLSGFAQKGQVMIGVQLQFWPLAGSPHGWLQGLSVQGQADIGVPQTFLTTPLGDFTMKSRYRMFAGQLRYRLPITGDMASGLSVEALTGWQQLRFGFDGATAGLELLPDAVLSSIRVGGGLSVAGGNWRARAYSNFHAGAKGGPYIDRFFDSAVTAFDVGGEVNIHSLHWLISAGVAYTRHRWVVTPGSQYAATGAIDQLTVFSLQLGYRL